MAKTKTTPPLNRKRPQPSLTLPIRRRKQPQPTLTSPHLPFDLVEEILCRLSVKHLLQLRCVCKSWNYLISQDSNFAKKHLRLSTSSHNRHHLTRIPNVYPKKFVVCHYPISSICTSGSTTRRVKQFTYSVTGILNKENYGHRASTCDGIICFKLNESLAVLCNPSIRKFKLLPPLKLPYQLFISYTLGYHCFTNNYKIIALNETWSRKIEVYVHTLGTDYWRRIPDFLGPNEARTRYEYRIRYVSDTAIRY
ncbi:putative F-box protein At3g47150 [Vicia villosa]|uniref:putative F-box protein At3g47150 n=1 Tax=Vicia villosa TaxID=3911 RepID=UPI00273BC7A7|nr:putative F-box protein At3g47150 [Vicia villosa]